MPQYSHNRGVTLVELLVTIAITGFLLLGVAQIFSSTRASYNAQQALGQVQEKGRFAIDYIAHSLRDFAYQPSPWNDSTQVALTFAALNGGGGASDQLTFRYYSNKNCFNAYNPVLGSGFISDTYLNNVPAFHVKEFQFSINGNNDLVETCRYGPDESSLAVQINNQVLIDNVESLQLRYGADADADNNADIWTTWDALGANQGSVMAAEIGVVIASDANVGLTSSQTFTVLDQSYTTPTDSNMRKLFVTTINLRNTTF